MKLRYGYVERAPQKRLTPKSAFLRKLERMQRKQASASNVLQMVKRK